MMTDSRDGRTYKTVKIGTQEWMAQNLNVDIFDSQQLGPGPWCKDASNDCAKYGRFYDYETAQNACPNGWHLPSAAEWQVLADAVGGLDVAGNMLKSATGWNGEDAYGFNALPAGVSAPRNYGQTINVSDEGKVADFWSADYRVVGMSTSYPNVALMDASYLAEGRSVRCLKGPKTETSCSSYALPITIVNVNAGSEYDAENKILKDLRDGKTYKTVAIGPRIWMAENLNVDYVVDNHLYGNNCNTDDCKTYGRYYTWAAAMDSASVFGTNGSGCGMGVICSPTYPVRGICPEHWHLPDMEEWEKLYSVIGSSPYAMQATGFEKWPKATNASDFSARSAGLYSGGFSNEGQRAYFWGATAIVEDVYFNNRYYSGKHVAHLWVLDANSAGGGSIYSKEMGAPVRCVYDEVGGEVSKYDASTNTLKDYRDGNVYKTVTIGSQIWMAENLNFKYEVNMSSYGSLCNTDKSTITYTEGCEKYGRYYYWAAAMDSAGIYSDNGKGCGRGPVCSPKYPVRGICPNGWHLPDSTEWETLYLSVGNLYALQETGYEQWDEATNASGFSVIPSGLYSGSFGFVEVGAATCFWSSFEEVSRRDAYVWALKKDKAYFERGRYGVCSIRCLKD